MVKYTCPICNKEFTKKYNFEKHTINKKKPCKVIIDNIFEVPPTNHHEPPSLHQKPPELHQKAKYSCEYCAQIFTRQDALKRHIDNRCKEKKKIDEETNMKDENLKHKKDMDEKKKEFKKELKKLTEQIEKLNNTPKINNINKGIINNNIIIPKEKLVEFGKEDLSKIDLEKIHEILEKPGYPALVAYLNAIHNNPDLPEYMNSYASDKSRDKGMIWQNGDWKQTTIQKIFLGVMDHIEKYIKLTEQRIKKGKYNSKKDQFSKDILVKFHNRLKIYYERYSGDDETKSKKDNKKFEELTKEHIINELCNFKNDVTKNFKNILLEIQEEPEPRDNKSIDKVSQEFDEMIREIDHLKNVLNQKDCAKNYVSKLQDEKSQKIRIISDNESDTSDEDENEDD